MRTDEKLTVEEHCLLSQRLAEATRAGRLADAYHVLSRLKPDDVEMIAVRAGFSVINKRDKGAFLRHIQSQLASASQAHVDGYGLNAHTTSNEETVATEAHSPSAGSPF